MKQEKVEKARQRKPYAAAGTRGQKPMNFRLDIDLEDWLCSKPNKGRYINDLIRADMESQV